MYYKRVYNKKNNASKASSNSTEEESTKIILENNIDLVLNVPCGKMKNFIANVPEKIMLSISRESVGVGIAVGAYLAGGKPLLLIQNTGLGNSIINIASLNMNYKIPLPILFSWRGVELENIKAQNNFGKLSESLLKAMNIEYYIARERNDLNCISKTIASAYQNNSVTSCLISPTFWDSNNEININYSPRKISEKIIKQDYLDEDIISISRYEALENIVDNIEQYDSEAVIVCNLGIPSMELNDILKKRKSSLRTFFMLAGFGEVSAIGLGLSMYSDRNIYVIDGDGSLFHNPNVLDSIISVSPANFSVFAIDNGVHSSTGNQMTMSHKGIDLKSIALAYGFDKSKTKRVFNSSQINNIFLNTFLNNGPNFYHVLVTRGNANVKEVEVSCIEIKEKLMGSL